MGWKDGNGLGKYQQRTTTNLRAYCCSGMMGIADKVSGENSGVRAWWQRYGTIWIDMVEEKMRDVKRRDVVQRRLCNGLEGRRRTGQISTGNDYQPEGVSSLR